MCPTIGKRNGSPLQNRKGFQKCKNTITVINLVKLLKSDLPFKLKMGGWGSLDVIKLKSGDNKKQNVFLQLQYSSLELSGQAENQFSSHYF
jgi:hypothetical protein